MNYGRFGGQSPARAPHRPQADQGFVSSTLTSVKEFFNPPTTAERKQRHQLFQNVAIFGGAIVAIVVFEEKIKNLMDFAEKELN